MIAPKYGLLLMYAGLVYPARFLKPSVTFFMCPLRSGTRTDWTMPPYVMMATCIPFEFVTVYLVPGVPLKVPTLDWSIFGLAASAGAAIAPIASTITSAHKPRMWVLLPVVTREL